jgi:RNA polymerase sigma factor (sigma-70 family)
VKIDPVEHLGLVAYWAKKYGAKQPLVDSEQFADGCVGLLIAIQKWVPGTLSKFTGKEVSFAGFASIWIRQQMLYRRSLEKRRLKRAGVEAVVNMQDLDALVSVETACLAEKADSALACKLYCERLLSALEPRDRDVMYRRFWLNQKLHEIGDAHSITKERVRQIIGSSLRALRIEVGVPSPDADAAADVRAAS